MNTVQQSQAGLAESIEIFLSRVGPQYREVADIAYAQELERKRATR